MKKHVVVVFTNNNARIIKTTHPGAYEKYPNCVINPDLTEVMGTPPHFWRLKGGKIVPMEPYDKIERNKEIASVGADNEIKLFKFRFWHKLRPSPLQKWRFFAMLEAIALATGATLWYLGGYCG